MQMLFALHLYFCDAFLSTIEIFLSPISWKVLDFQGEKAVLSSRMAAAAASAAASAAPFDDDALRQQVAHLDQALKAEQRRAAEYYAQLTEALSSRGMGGGMSTTATTPSRSPLGPRTGKKSDDVPSRLPGVAGGDVYDPETAVLEGASAAFLPLAGWLRGRGGALALPAAAVGLLDKMTVALYRRPMARVVLMLYLLILHLAVFLF